MATKLGDFAVAETVDLAGDLLARRFSLFAPIVALLFVPITAIFMTTIFYLSPQTTVTGAFEYFIGMFTDPERAMMSYDLRGQSLAIAAQGVYFLLNLFLITPLVTGALTRAGIAAYLNENLSRRDVLIWAVKNWWRLSSASILTWLLIIGLSLFAAVIFFLPVGAFFYLRENLPPALMLPVMIFAVLGLGAMATVWLIANVKLTLVYSAIAAENCGQWTAITRSAALTKSRISRGIWLLFVGSTIGMFASTAVNCIPNAGALGILGSLAQGVSLMITTIIAVGYYFNCRSFHDNFDILTLMDASDADC